MSWMHLFNYSWVIPFRYVYERSPLDGRVRESSLGQSPCLCRINYYCRSECLAITGDVLRMVAFRLMMHELNT
jgi:hypothetical protein